jgi:hypothetical protein
MIEQLCENAFRNRCCQRRQLRFFLSEQIVKQATLSIVGTGCQSLAKMLNIELRYEDALVHHPPAIRARPDCKKYYSRDPRS